MNFMFITAVIYTQINKTVPRPNVAFSHGTAVSIQFSEFSLSFL